MKASPIDFLAWQQGKEKLFIFLFDGSSAHCKLSKRRKFPPEPHTCKSFAGKPLQILSPTEDRERDGGLAEKVFRGMIWGTLQLEIRGRADSHPFPFPSSLLFIILSRLTCNLLHLLIRRRKHLLLLLLELLHGERDCGGVGRRRVRVAAVDAAVALFPRRGGGDAAGGGGVRAVELLQ